MSFTVMFGEDVIPAYGANFLLGSLPSGLTYTNSSAGV